MTGDGITRLADRVEAIFSDVPLGRMEQETKAIAAELRTLAQQGEAGGVAEGLNYVPGLLDQTCPPKVWLQIDTSGDNDDRDVAAPESCWGDLTWCYESIGGQEVVYIRADLVPHANPPEAGVTALIDFAKWAIRNSAFDGCDLDGCDVQEKATELGLLEEVKFSEPCSEDHCACAEAGAEFPTTCYRFSGYLAPQPKDAT